MFHASQELFQYVAKDRDHMELHHVHHTPKLGCEHVSQNLHRLPSRLIPVHWTSAFGNSLVFVGLVSYYIYYILVAAQMPLIAITGKSVFFNALEDFDGDGCLGLCVGYRGGSLPLVYMDTINAAGTPVTGSQKVITPTAEQVTGDGFPLQDFGDLTWDMVKSDANGDVWLDRVFQLV